MTTMNKQSFSTNKKIIIGFIILTVLILGGGVYILSSTNSSTKVSSSQNAKIEVDAKTFDWGNIPYGGGTVSKNFILKNTGSDILKLTNIKTSCMCTNAYLEIDGKLSPAFGMHESASYIGEVLPGKQANLKVVFDPAFHGPSGVGPIERLVSIQTNDINNPALEFSLKGVVVK